MKLWWIRFGGLHEDAEAGILGGGVEVVHNMVRRLELVPLNFAEEKRSRRRQAWTEGWEGDRQARA